MVAYCSNTATLPRRRHQSTASQGGFGTPLKERWGHAYRAGCTRSQLSQVEGEAQGNDDGIQKLLKDLNDGPSAAHVAKVEKSELATKEGESSFEVRR